MSVPRAGSLPPSDGLPGAALRPAQAGILRALAGAYIERLTPALAAPRLARLDAHLPAVHFAWAGSPGTEPGDPHYYRLHGPGLLVELDNTQNGANHVHSVWRDPDGDFGGDLLAGMGTAGEPEVPSAP